MSQVEDVMTALQSHLQDAVGSSFKAIGRRVKFWTDQNDQPWLGIRHTGTRYEYGENYTVRRYVDVELWIYVKASADPTSWPDTDLNDLVETVESAFAPDDPDNVNALTLGGAVYWARIEGDASFDPGDNDEQSKAVLPVRILLP